MSCGRKDPDRHPAGHTCGILQRQIFTRWHTAAIWEARDGPTPSHGSCCSRTSLPHPGDCKKGDPDGSPLSEPWSTVDRVFICDPSSYQFKIALISLRSYKRFFVSLMVTKKNKPLIDTQRMKKKKSKHNTARKSSKHRG